MNEYEFLNQIFDDLSNSVKKFKGVYTYVKERKECECQDKFDNGIQGIDKVLENVFARMEKIK